MTLQRGAALCLVAALWSSPALSHPLYDAHIAPEPARSESERESSGRCCGLERLRTLLGAADESKRIAAYLRVRARDDDDAWRLLAEQVSHGRLERSPAEDLALARVVAPSVRRKVVRPIVAQLAFATSARLDPAEPLRLLAMQICIMALAWSQSPDALIALGRALKNEGALSDASRDALLVHPPEPFAQLFSSAVARSPAWTSLLGASHRSESIPILRRVLLEDSEEMQLAAAKALVQLGDRAMEPLLEQWSRDPKTPEPFRRLAESWLLHAASGTAHDIAPWPVAPESKALKREEKVRQKGLLCSGLLHERIHRTAATAWLMTMAHGKGACAPLAAEALAVRDSVELRDALRRLLWAPHPLMRAAVARGLALSLEPSAAGLLVSRFAIEDEPRVRRAIVRALARRKSRLAHQLLLDAARFDPDARVRNLADRGSSNDPLQAAPGDCGRNAHGRTLTRPRQTLREQGSPDCC